MKFEKIDITKENVNKLESIFISKFKEVYQNYLIVGGMPECVDAWIRFGDARKVEQIQNDLIVGPINYIEEKQNDKNNILIRKELDTYYVKTKL